MRQSDGQDASPRPRKMWAYVAGGAEKDKVLPSLSVNHKENLERLKSSVKDMVYIDDEFTGRTLKCM